MAKKKLFSRGINVGIPERARQVANQNTGFTSSCPVVELDIIIITFIKSIFKSLVIIAI